MRVTFYGVRGSVPTPGPSTVRYGGNTVCVEVRLADGSLIVLDAGTGIRELGKHMLASASAAPIHLLITHAHWDHIIGLPFFAPLYRKETRVVLHPVTDAARRRALNPIVFDGEHFPVRFADLPARIEHDNDVGQEFRIGSGRVRHIELNHPGGAVGFRIDDDDGTSLCYLTDNELAPPGPLTTTAEELARFAAGTSLMIHDAQYLPADMPAKKGWGHSLVSEVLELGRAAEARAVALHHHEPERDDDALDRIALDADAWARVEAPAMRTIVAREGLSLELTGR
jgi:phosphoribosyl 1,2-cyclic phosphodiesterase